MTDAQVVPMERFGIAGPAFEQYLFQPDGNSDSMCAIQNMIRQVAPTNSNVLILGESGTGKEMVARHIHELSARRGRAFVPVNCGAIPTELLESELLGTKKAHSRVRSARESGAFSMPKAARCSWTKSGTCRFRCK